MTEKSLNQLEEMLHVSLKTDECINELCLHQPIRRQAITWNHADILNRLEYTRTLKLVALIP